MNLFIVVNVDWFFLSHRLPIALAAKEAGYDVTIITRDTGKKEQIESYGLKFIEVPFERSGSNPLHEFKCIYLLAKLYRKYHPDIIHHVTLKASLLGCIAAKLAGRKKVVNAISGFGYNFTEGRDGLKQKIIKQQMNWAFKSDFFHFIFQNPDDVDQFKRFKFVSDSQIHIIKGSGVDLIKFSFEEESKKEKVRILLSARMLYDKGVVEFIEAAKKIKEDVVQKAEFILAGSCDTINLSGISEKSLNQMIDGSYIRWIGHSDNILSELKSADIVVLPSYREGLPKSLIEACAVGRPIITTDTQGCRECVKNNYNGFLVPVKDIDNLAEKMIYLINNKQERERMGINSRKLAESEFSIEKVVDEHLKIYEKILDKK